MNEYEISKLKKELVRKNQIIKQIKEDLAFVENQLVSVQAERDKYHGQLQIARNTIENVDQIIDQKVRQMRSKLEHENAASFNELQALRDRLMEEQKVNQRHNEQIRNKDAVISQLSLRLREMSIKYKDNSLQLNVKEISEQAAITYNQFYKLTEKYNKLSEDMENILAENKILRKLHGVPDNFGFDLEQIKIAEKQELEDYKAQCRKLETQIQELQAERTQLRYRLRQYNTLYSNKGERYKDLTQRQLELLDNYALKLKDGKDQQPQIDKTHKQLQMQITKLRAQVEILQSKTPMSIMPGGKTDSVASTEMSKQSMKKVSDQIKSILQPFVQDIKKISETNINSIIQNVQNIQGDTNTTNVINIPAGPSGLRPPIALPFNNNDWSTIKEGYSYRYSCKIPVDLKDLDTDVGFDVIKAKYEIAALQLQNIESLKMLKQKQDQQKLIKFQLNDLKQKFKKCLLVQDEVFIRYFKERDNFRQNIKKSQIQKRRAIDEKEQLKSRYLITEEAFNALNAKTDIESKFKDFAERLAKSEAALTKNERKYQIIFEEHKYLRDSYTKMQQKAAKNQEHLKTKCLVARANERQLTLLMNQVLDQTKDSVSSDTHNLLLAKMQMLNDKSAHFAFKQAELRLKISRLQSIERQMNIKDDMIEYLRQDKLDILLELQVIRNRLRTIDPAYRQALSIFERLVGFINQNSISILQTFKKFDKDKSGLLTKDEFRRALEAFRFDFKSSEQFELLFGQFDLDGSGHVNYTQFMRKLKRGGAISRSKDEQAVYLFFKAIKSANISIKRAFDIVDKDGSGTVTKAEMQTAFRKIGIPCDSKTIDAIYRIVDEDMDGSLSCVQLQKLYYEVIRETQIDEIQIRPELDWKYQFILKLEEATINNKMTILETFKTLDDDGSNYMTIQQLSVFLTKAGVSIDRRQLDELFKFFDSKYDGKIQYNEFTKVLDEAKREQKRIQRLQSVHKRAQQLRKQNEVKLKQVQSIKPSQEAMLKIRMQALQTKQSNLIKKTENLCKSLAHKEQQIKQLQKSIQQNQKQLNKVQDKYTEQRQINITLTEKNKKSISDVEAKNLRQEHQKIRIKNGELSTELDTFKGLVSTLTDKNKVELMSVEKIKAELNKHYDIVKQLQAENINKSELGRLAMELEYSKRNQQIVNKKYEDACQEQQMLAKMNSDLSTQGLEKQKQIVNVHLLMREKTNLLQKNIDSLTGKILPTMTMSKIDEFMSKLRVLSTSKSQLQQQNKGLREKNFNLQLKYDHIEIQKANLVELEKKLRRNYTDDSSVALIDLTKQLSDYKMSELKAKRQFNLLKQKEQYYMRINNANNDNIKELEGELGKWEIKFNQRQQFWRKRMADQMKLVDQIQKEVQKTKQNQAKAQKYFNQKQIQDAKIQQQYDSLGQQRMSKLSKFVKAPSVYRQEASNNEKIQQLKGQVQQLTFLLQQKQREVHKLKTAIQEIVPEEKLRFSSIGSQIGSQMQTNSFILQTELTTSQLKNNARRFISNQKQQQAFFREEAEKMAQAAQQSIDTLQRIIDDKNEQLRRKQKLIDDLKRDMLKNKEQDCYQIQKLNEEIRELRSKKQVAGIEQLMNRSTHRQFYPATGGNDQKIKSLIEMLEDKNIEIQNWQKKYNELYINKSKIKAPDNANNKVVQGKLRDLMEERESQRKKYVEAQNKMKDKVKNLQKLIKQKDLKLSQLHKTITDLKSDIINEKQELSQQGIEGNEQLIQQMIRGNTGNDSKMQAMLQKALQTIQTMTKKNRQYEAEIKKMKEQSRLHKTMSRR